jgi:hypothetical protein
LKIEESFFPVLKLQKENQEQKDFKDAAEGSGDGDCK